jgi:hypothetical protein
MAKEFLGFEKVMKVLIIVGKMRQPGKREMVTNNHPTEFSLLHNGSCKFSDAKTLWPCKRSSNIANTSMQSGSSFRCSRFLSTCVPKPDLL